MVELLLKNGADINRQDKLGRTPLYMATEATAAKCVDVLLKHKANVNIAEKRHGKTPLHEAAKYGYDNIAEKLLVDSADLSAVDKKGRTAKDIATRRGILKIIHIYIQIFQMHINFYSFRSYQSCTINN